MTEPDKSKKATQKSGLTLIGKTHIAPTRTPESKKPNLVGWANCLNLLAEWTGLEPATPGVTGRYSNQLNYHSPKEARILPQPWMRRNKSDDYFSQAAKATEAAVQDSAHRDHDQQC